MLCILSRPALKGMVRRGNNVLQICKQLAAAKNMNDEETTEELSEMREAMGVLQQQNKQLLLIMQKDFTLDSLHVKM